MPLTKPPYSMLDPDVAAAIAAANVKLSGDTVQVVNVQTGAVSTGSTIIPRDDTIPQNTEGTQFLSASITPTSASNFIDIHVVLHASCSVTSDLVAALFQDSGVNAIAVGTNYGTTNLGVMGVTLRFRMLAGTTSSTTFNVRMGPITAGTVTLNGASGGRYYGGTLISSITLTEIKA